MGMEMFLTNKIHDHKQIIEKQEKVIIAKAILFAHAINKTIKAGGKIFFSGNGGSASDAMHLAAEFVGRFDKKEQALPAIALPNIAAITAIANDYHYDQVIARQISALGQQSDLLFVISTSGNSENLINATKIAQLKGMTVFGLLGKSGGILKDKVDDYFIVDSDITARIQEIHIMFGHLMCHVIEEYRL